MARFGFWFQANTPASSKLLLALCTESQTIYGHFSSVWAGLLVFLSEDCVKGVVAGEGEPNQEHAGINCSLGTSSDSIQNHVANGAWVPLYV